MFSKVLNILAIVTYYVNDTNIKNVLLDLPDFWNHFFHFDIRDPQWDWPFPSDPLILYNDSIKNLNFHLLVLLSAIRPQHPPPPPLDEHPMGEIPDGI